MATLNECCLGSKSFPSNGKIFEVARGLLVPGRAGDFNQALMDLGATICTPFSPSCVSCPVSQHCGARAAGTISQYPPPKVKKKPKKVQMVALVIFEGDRILMVKRQESGLFGGMYDLPGGEVASGETVAQAAHRVAFSTAWRDVECHQADWAD